MNSQATNAPEFHRLLRRAWIEIAIFSIIINIFLLAPSVYMMQIYDRVLPASSVPTLVYLSLLAAGALGFLALMDVIRSIYCQRVAVALDRNIGGAAFLASVNSPKGESGDIQALRDLSTVRTFIASRGLANLVDLPFAPLFMLLLYFVHPILCLVTVLGAVVMVLLVIANHFAAKTAGSKAQEAATIANLLAQAFTRNADTLRGMGMLGNVTEVWGKRFAESAVLQDKASVINSSFAGASRALRMALQLAILGAGAVLVMRGEMTAGMIFASSTISGRALQPIDQLVAGWKQVADARKSWGKLDAAVATVEEGTTRRLQLPEPKGSVAVKDLVWTPPPTSSAPGSNAPIIKRLSFEIAAGEAVALLGPSGAGKSTLAKLLAGVNHPTSGLVTLDGADYRTWDPEQLGSSIGYLAQDVQLLPGSIAQNVARFDPSATDEAITAAASRAEAHALVTAQRQGYQTLITPTASTLSGGTRQRIGLARAFYGNPKVLVLDEPNANLDAEGEAALEKALIQARASGTTIIIITHRPAIVLRCDKAIVLRDGTIEAFGPAPEILRRLPSRGGAPRPPDPPVAPSKSTERLTLVHDGTE
ncbi:type I secretion system permease/ATPase [Rhizobium leguminosarum bv. viciae]|uniref:type I secretion system permease/ATPase n=1 Tax=Rhizobium leguminosarum TaxID=384 RepID=UPI0014420451|nr:type I secretion system permease/ATPase [Rhizobium leguminosarum]MBY5474673.1 type I secretion system permease/ATPase [Rhizobium leguminosarum]NKL73136.1 type I secretion system permease/ATPase [Rhizobium leguminosarum bv. viciae]